MKNTTRIGIVLGISVVFFAAEIAGRQPYLEGSSYSILMVLYSWLSHEEFGINCGCGASNYATLIHPTSQLYSSITLM